MRHIYSHILLTILPESATNLDISAVTAPTLLLKVPVPVLDAVAVITPRVAAPRSATRWALTHNLKSIFC